MHNWRMPRARLSNWPTSGRMSRDLAIGRIYLPRVDRERFHYPEGDLRALRFTPQFAELMKFQVERARALFAAGRELLGRIPGELAVDIDLFSRGGLAILDRIEAQGFDVLGSRPALSRRTKLALLLRTGDDLAAAFWWCIICTPRWGSHISAPGNALGKEPKSNESRALKRAVRSKGYCVLSGLTRFGRHPRTQALPWAGLLRPLRGQV